MTITNETIIKAAKAAGVELSEGMSLDSYPNAFNPLHNDHDNAMIRRGAEIDVLYRPWKDGEGSVVAKNDCLGFEISFCVDYESYDKAQAEREAVILCAAEKWDAQGEKA